MTATMGTSDVCEFSGDPDHDYCKHCGTCFTCIDEHNDQLADKCNQLNIALCKAQEKIEQLEKELKTEKARSADYLALAESRGARAKEWQNYATRLENISY